jgi:hypothetical protein
MLDVTLYFGNTTESNMKQDFFGKELNVGDEVAFIAPGYRHLAKGIIQRFTDKMVIIDYSNTWNFSGTGRPDELKQTPDQLVKCGSYIIG